VCYSCNKDRRQFGTGFLINKKYKHLIVGFSPETDRICSLRIRGRFFNTTIICVHVPTEEKDEIQKDDFYGDLERIYTRCDPKVLRRVVLKEYCALHLAADTITT
jgi:hypothetical protein